MAETPTDPGRAPLVSVIVPTLNEAGNIDALLQGIFDHAGPAALDLEVIVVDDGSTDGTRERVSAWESDHPVHLVARDGERGLAGAVLAGAGAAAGEVAVVMDADLSHPPDKIADLVRPILEGKSDVVIGSRHVPGGGNPGWPLSRRLVSRSAAALARVMVDARDPLSGFFSLRRKRLIEDGRNARGFKIGLEVLLRGAGLRVQEVPITFRDRTSGQSKLRLAVIGTYLRQLADHAGGAVSTRSGTRFALVGLAGAVTDFAVFHLLFHGAGASLGSAHLGGFFAATLLNYVLNSRWTFTESAAGPRSLSWRGYLAFGAVALMAVFLRGGVLALLVERWGFSPTLAIVPAILSAAAVNYLGCAFFVFSPPAEGAEADQRWRVAAVGVLAYTVLLRLLYVGQLELFPEEAYYWNYSQHLDLSYLDHPPMAAWLIAIGTAIFGQTEFGVRSAALGSWLVAAVFAYLFVRNVGADRGAALRALLLLAALPFFFGVGCFMTPDAPVFACWAGTLHFLERALLAERPRAWLGAGACLGIGLLSKYTIALVALAAFAYLLLDRGSRRWLLRPEPYLALAAAALLFSPVIVWNAQHDWASFTFQGPQRWEHGPEFELPRLIAFVLVLLTPLGLLGFLAGVRARPRTDPARRFVLVFTLVPLSVFVVASLWNETKLNWTGPLWLAALPALAATLSGRGLLARSWKPAIVVLLVGYGALLHGVVLGLPVGALPASNYTLAWRDLGRQVEEIEAEVAAKTGAEPIIVGMDKYRTSSALAFYDPDHDGAHETAGQHLFGRESLMYGYWFPPELQEGRTLVLVGSHPEDLNNKAIRTRTERLEPIRELTIERAGTVAHYYARVAYSYRPVRSRASRRRSRSAPGRARGTTGRSARPRTSARSGPTRPSCSS